MIKERNASGLTINDYCKQKEISRNVLLLLAPENALRGSYRERVCGSHKTGSAQEAPIFIRAVNYDPDTILTSIALSAFVTNLCDESVQDTFYTFMAAGNVNTSIC